MMMRQAEVAWSPSGTIRMMCALLLSVLVTTGEAFLTTPALVPRSVGRSGLRALVPHRSLRSGGISMTGGEQRVQIEKDEDAVGIALCDILKDEYSKAVAAKDGFSFAISGGSMLKMLANLQGDASGIDWGKCAMAFVSHRCVALDSDGATYHKARPLFLDSWIEQGLTCITPSGSNDSDKEAMDYELAMKSLPSNVLSHSSSGYPEFDLVLIGIGTDGHVGSIYPNIPDVESKAVMVPITGVDAMKKLSTKISFSLATMKSAKRSVVACAGKSAKAPLGKAQAMVRGLESPDETPMSFPASSLRKSATWLIDVDSASLLSQAAAGTSK